MGHYDRLSALDALFLELEDDQCHMHVAAALLFDGRPLQGSHGGLDMERLRAYLESRLHLIPRYRQRLAYIPVEQHPVWIDDDRFNLFYHVRHSALPRPGDERQLKRLCGRILSQKLDPTKPLWEIWVIEGLADDRFALIAKTHHAMVDGVAGMDLLQVVLSPMPMATFESGPPWRPRAAPSSPELIAGEIARRTAGAASLARRTLGAIATPRESLATARDTVTGVIQYMAPSATPASPTPFNVPLGPHRRFDWVRMSLPDVKAVRTALGGTLNDVVLATVTGAARRFLMNRGVSVTNLNFRAMVPVSVRADAERGAPGNRVANLVVPLPIGEPDRRTRYRRVVEATSQQKRTHAVEGGEFIGEIANWTVTSLLTRTIQLAADRLVWNLVVTNVPGPQLPLYLLDAPLQGAYPMVPLFRQQGFGIALFSYDGSLCWGLNADWDALPDLHDLADALEQEFSALRDAAAHAN
jgi:diacylglycerol O-acyltransferase / wax synthase